MVTLVSNKKQRVENDLKIKPAKDGMTFSHVDIRKHGMFNLILLELAIYFSFISLF